MNYISLACLNSTVIDFKALHSSINWQAVQLDTHFFMPLKYLLGLRGLATFALIKGTADTKKFYSWILSKKGVYSAEDKKSILFKVVLRKMIKISSNCADFGL